MRRQGFSISSATTSTLWDSPALPFYQACFRHQERDLVLCSHVDDLVVCGSQGDVAWLVNELEKKFTLSGGGLVPAADQDPKDPVRFLKKRHFFTSRGVVISPYEKSFEELVKACRLENKKPKATPDIALECLDGEVKSWMTWRSTCFDPAWAHCSI